VAEVLCDFRLGMTKKRAIKEAGETGERRKRAGETGARVLKIRNRRSAPKFFGPDPPTDKSPHALKLIRAADNNCRWPLNEPTVNMLVCGAIPLSGLPYCLRHARIAYPHDWK
jgi:hypothetical protein